MLQLMDLSDLDPQAMKQFDILTVKEDDGKELEITPLPDYVDEISLVQILQATMNNTAYSFDLTEKIYLSIEGFGLTMSSKALGSFLLACRKECRRLKKSNPEQYYEIIDVFFKKGSSFKKMIHERYG